MGWFDNVVCWEVRLETEIKLFCQSPVLALTFICLAESWQVTSDMQALKSKEFGKGSLPLENVR